MAEADSTTLPTRIPTPLNVTALAKRFGVARTTIQRRLKKGWLPPARCRASRLLRSRRLLHCLLRGAASMRHQWLRRQRAPAVLRASFTPSSFVASRPLLHWAWPRCSAGMSITGLTAIFAGAYWATIVGMGVSKARFR